jgi:hypothetical protein
MTQITAASITAVGAIIAACIGSVRRRPPSNGGDNAD